MMSDKEFVVMTVEVAVAWLACLASTLSVISLRRRVERLEQILEDLRVERVKTERINIK